MGVNTALLPTATLGVLHRADGSASFTHHATKMIVSVNGPMEIRLRDEMYNKAVVEIVVRPSVGVATYREKYIESRLHDAITPIMLLTLAPRTLVQIVVQIIQIGGVEAGSGQEYSPFLLLPSVIATTVLALLDAGVPLTTTLDAFLVTTNPLEKKKVARAATAAGDVEMGESSEEEEDEEEGTVITVNPYGQPDMVKKAVSKHVLVYSTAVSAPEEENGKKRVQGELVFVESEGEFAWKEFEAVELEARRACMGITGDDDEEDMMDVEEEGASIHGNKKWGKGMMATLIRQAVGQKVAKDLRWRK
ncbi:ribosomal protein S5 domain 2-type protein [Peziza echinospora]|nr:ribosomal protein S5 domain 2-type protein [Peziza echinospora]